METTSNKHQPRYQYDCGRCKFSWCCGFKCWCIYKHTLPDPPRTIKKAVDRELVSLGFKKEFYE